MPLRQRDCGSGPPRARGDPPPCRLSMPAPARPRIFRGRGRAERLFAEAADGQSEGQGLGSGCTAKSISAVDTHLYGEGACSLHASEPMLPYIYIYTYIYSLGSSLERFLSEMNDQTGAARAVLIRRLSARRAWAVTVSPPPLCVSPRDISPRGFGRGRTPQPSPSPPGAVD